jgi:4-hydroxybenzoate polyprenyltransferase
VVLAGGGVNPGEPPRIVVDADRLLAGSTVAAECLVDAVRRRPLLLLRIIWWALRGRERLGRELARHADPDGAALPYRAEAIEELRGQLTAGRRVVVVSGGGEALARKVAAPLGFEAGEETADGSWRAPSGVVPPRAIVGALRPAHWLKNILVVLPFLLAHEIGGAGQWVAAALMFAAFSLCASAGYVINDILDRGQDRRHPRRSRRPIASGALPLGTALWLPLPLLASAAICCAFLPAGCGLALAIYAVLTVVYSTAAKRLVMADVLLLAGLYLLRLIAGSMATGNTVSHWLLAFALTLFLSLALTKRVSELTIWRGIDCDHAPGRGYRATDAPVLEAMAVASGFLACLIMVLYIQSPEILRLYRRPQYLWLGVIALLYWLGRLFVASHRGEGPDDPLLFVLEDRTTFGMAAAAVALAVAAV